MIQTTERYLYKANCFRCIVKRAKGFIQSTEEDCTSMFKIPVCPECLSKDEEAFLEEEF